MVFTIGFISWGLGGFFARVFKEMRFYGLMWTCVSVSIVGFFAMLYSLLSLAAVFLP